LKDQLISLLECSLDTLRREALIPEVSPVVTLEPTKHEKYGDLSSNLAMLLAKPCRMAPMAIAKLLVEHIPAHSAIEKIEVVAPGFINFFVNDSTLFAAVARILANPAECGRSTAGHGQRIQLEFVSANPTGPLHVGHGRGAAYGAALANLLRAVGYDVHTEYYVNDAGRQMDILALSVWLRYLEQHTPDSTPAVLIPDNAYRGTYVAEIASSLGATHGLRFLLPAFSPPRLTDHSDGEVFLDSFVDYCRTALGDERYRLLHQFGCDAILADIRDDLARFGVVYDQWYSERSLLDRGLLNSSLEKLKQTRFVYEKDGALWFQSTAFGDEKDRVVVRENGVPTYFASDIAYHLDKFARGFDIALNIWGADHHGYIPRVRAALSALGLEPSRLEVLLVQFASLYRGGQKVQMSTRSGQFVTLRELVSDVGVDAARFFYTSRRSDQHLDFDLDLAKAQSQENPVYYLQYAHARISSVFRQLAQQGGEFEPTSACAHLGLLKEPKERAIGQLLARYAEVVWNAAQNREPHAIASYLRDLATEYHAFYNAHKIIVEDIPLRRARLALCAAIGAVLRDGLLLLGVSAPEEM
jgi:arginyl-tRNA synthetase